MTRDYAGSLMPPGMVGRHDFQVDGEVQSASFVLGTDGEASESGTSEEGGHEEPAEGDTHDDGEDDH